MACRVELDSVSAVGAATVHFQPMPAHPKTRPVDGGLQHFLDVAAFQVCGGAAYCAEQVMMMALVAELVTKFPIFQQDATDLVGFHQQTEAAIDGGPADTGQGGAQLFGGEGTPLGGGGGDDQTPRFGVPIAHPDELNHDFVHYGGGTGPRMVVANVFDGLSYHIFVFDTPYCKTSKNSKLCQPSQRQS